MERNMRFEQTRDILDHAREFHHRVGEIYHCLSDKAERQRAKILLDYMSRREVNLEKAMEYFEGQAAQGVLNTWFNYTQKEETLALQEDEALRPDMTVEEVVRAALRLDDCLITLYRKMADSAASAEVRAVFKSLLAMEEKEKRQLARNAQLMSDL
jgi:hypothetical protein